MPNKTEPPTQAQVVRVTAIGSAGLLAYLLFFVFEIDSYDRAAEPDETTMVILSGLVATVCGVFLAVERMHLRWHGGRIALLLGAALIVTLLSPAHLVGLPLLIVAGAFAWSWLPERKA